MSSSSISRGASALRWVSAGLVLAACFGAAVSCKSSGIALSVDLRTDYVPGREFGSVVTEVVAGGEGARASEHAVELNEKGFVDGARIADFGDVPAGEVTVRVKVLSKTGAPLVERLARLAVKGDYALTVVVTRNCEGIVCPEEGGDPAKTTCDRGKCVPPDCTLTNPGPCPEAECFKDADCHEDVDCVTARCIAGTCLFIPEDLKCLPTQTCDVAVGCSPPAKPKCEPTGATETNCGDGKDDDCDGRIDCMDPDCDAKGCEDGDLCTEGETCVSQVCVGGKAKTCDDGNSCTADGCDPKKGCTYTNLEGGTCEDGDPCTTGETCEAGKCVSKGVTSCDDKNDCTADACDSKLGCTHTDLTGGKCDDGVFCNGADTCKDGKCDTHAGSPCPSFCNEGSDTCASCLVDGDCGAPVFGAWSACGGFSDVCDTSGVQSRSVTRSTCNGSSCVPVTTVETQACPRATEDIGCGTTTFGAWGGCGGFATACDTTGSQSRTMTQRLCKSGTCTNVNSTQNQSCTRSVANGTGCGAGNYCCGGACVSKGSDAHCSSCGIVCNGSSTCNGIGGGHFSCTCSTNAFCVSAGFGPGATCWSPSGQMYCNCQCTGGGCCAGGANCVKPSGLNYCAYP